MKELFKNKLFIVFSFIICIFAVFSFSSVNASSEDETVTFYSEDFGCDVTITLPSGLGSKYQYYMINTHIISGRWPYRVNVWCANSEFLFDYVENGYCDFGTIDNSPYFNFELTEDYIPTNFSNKNVDFENGNPRTVRASTGLGKTIFSNTNVYNNANEVVFQAPPQQVEEQETPQPIQQVTIPAIQQVEEIPQGMSQVLQVIIPIGLIVLSIGLVVYLVRLVIYRLKS